MLRRNSNFIWSLILKQICGEISTAELTQLNKLFKQSPSIKSKAELLCQYWKLNDLHEVCDAEEAFDKLWYKIKKGSVTGD